MNFENIMLSEKNLATKDQAYYDYIYMESPEETSLLSQKAD